MPHLRLIPPYRRGGGGCTGMIAPGKLSGGGGDFRRAWESQSSKRLTHTITCRPMPRAVAEGPANHIATEGSRSSQHPKASAVPNTCPQPTDPRERSAMGIFTALPTPLNFAIFLEDRISPQNHRGLNPPPPTETQKPQVGVAAQRGHSANSYVVYPGGTPANHPPTEACMIHSKQHRRCGVQDPGTRGYRWWKTALFAQRGHSARCAPQGTVPAFHSLLMGRPK